MLIGERLSGRNVWSGTEKENSVDKYRTFSMFPSQLPSLLQGDLVESGQLSLDHVEGLASIGQRQSLTPVSVLEDRRGWLFQAKHPCPPRSISFAHQPCVRAAWL